MASIDTYAPADENGVRHVSRDALPVGTEVRFDLPAGQRMADPSSTKRVLYGPMRVSVTCWPDGLDVGVSPIG